MYENSGTAQVSLNDDIIRSLKTCEIVKQHVSIINHLKTLLMIIYLMKIWFMIYDFKWTFFNLKKTFLILIFLRRKK
jgi:hypothetical protein